MIDRFIQWPKQRRLQTYQQIVDTFFATWITRFGTPALITTDRGFQFESTLFEALTRTIGSRRIRTTAYHPEIPDRNLME